MIGATKVVIDQMPSAVARFSGGKTEISSAWLPGIIGPDTAPCSTRNTISEGRLHATPHSSDAIVNSTSETQKVRTTPKRRISQPVNGTEMPLETAKAVMIHVELSLDTPRFPAIVGNETLAIVLSSTIMNVPIASATDTSASRGPCSGGGAAEAEAAARATIPPRLSGSPR